MPLSLVILAAGMGSRYGGLKQIDPVGPQGQTILDYSIYDAHRAGFDEIVFIIRREFADLFRAKMERNPTVHGGVRTRYVLQELRELPTGFQPPPGREKPWGTAHAIWSVRREVSRPFAVVNADDFYGADAFRQLAGFLHSTHAGAHDYGLVGYRLGQTLSTHGTVARGVCKVDRQGYLVAIEEQAALEPDPAGGARTQRGDGTVAHFPADTVVSMNCWGLTPAIFPMLEAQLVSFLHGRGTDMKSECYLPAVVGKMVSIGQARVKVMATEARWCGVTYQEDRAAVQATLKALHDAGEYPGHFAG